MKFASERSGVLVCLLTIAIFLHLHQHVIGLTKHEKRISWGSSASGKHNKTEAAILNSSANATNSKEECPESDGFFPDPTQCDKYYVCSDGNVVEERLCPDGMVFNDFSPAHEKCDLPFNIDCSKRPKLQEPKPTTHCQRLNGYFGHEDATICNKFYYCVDGKFNMITCPDGLVYNEKNGICSWPDEAKKKGCTSQELFKFSCPPVDISVGQQHPRYPDPEDCQYFYVCINGEIPRRSGCKLGQVFNEATTSCDWPRNVQECSEWYKGVLTDEELAALENPPKPKPKEPTSGSKRQNMKKHNVKEITTEQILLKTEV